MRSHQRRDNEVGHRAEAALGALLVTSGALTGAALITGQLVPIFSVMAALVVAGGFVAFERWVRPPATLLQAGGLGHMAEKYRQNGLLTVPVAVVVIELRGIAADTLVDGPAAWSEPIGVVARRMAAADLGAGYSLARIGPHTFGAVFQCPDQAAAIAAAESLVSLCRAPIMTPAREVRIDAAAGVAHAAVGERCTGEELVRTADAALRVDGRIASPVATANHRLLRHARRIIEVETEIRHSLDVDLLTARLIPVVDVHLDVMVGLRAAYDWTSISSTDPETLGSIAASLGLRRAVETQYLMRAIAAAESVPVESGRRVVARLDPNRLSDPRAVGQIELLLDVSGLEARHLILEFESWGSCALERRALDALDEIGVGAGLSLRYRGEWDLVPDALEGRLGAISVRTSDLIDQQTGQIVGDRVEQLKRLCAGDLQRVTVCDVDSATSALELSTVGLTTQSGLVHGRAMSAADLRQWVVARAVG